MPAKESGTYLIDNHGRVDGSTATAVVFKPLIAGISAEKAVLLPAAETSANATYGSFGPSGLRIAGKNGQMNSSELVKRTSASSRQHTNF